MQFSIFHSKWEMENEVFPLDISLRNYEKNLYQLNVFISASPQHSQDVLKSCECGEKCLELKSATTHRNGFIFNAAVVEKFNLETRHSY